MNDASQTSTSKRDIYTVSRLLRETKAVLEGSFPSLWLEGEISNLSRPSSGHLYFSLKDSAGQVRCAMFRSRNLQVRFKPENGMQVLVRAKITLYEARGDFQIIIEHMEKSGLGELQRQFDELKEKLGREGLFNSEHKLPLPTMPKRIGVITSPTGAAIRDVLSVLERRFPAVPVMIYPTSVQGANAAKEIAQAIYTADKRKECDVLILTRGGGSLEDLWSFNEEIVARAVHLCNTPIVSAVGHEVDFTIADFVADMRAPTPSAAAVLVTPDAAELLMKFDKVQRQLQQQMQQCLNQSRQQLTWLERQLQQQHPGRELQNKAQRLDDLELKLKQLFQHRLAQGEQQLGRLTHRLQQQSPAHQLRQIHIRQEGLYERLQTLVKHRLQAKQQQLGAISRTLDSVSPLATLQRGYAIVQTPKGEVVRTTEGLTPGDKVSARLASGRLHCTIDTIDNEVS